jgi:hypothetical protein
MPASAPPVDPRTYAELVEKLESLLQLYTAWRPPAVPSDPGQPPVPDSGQALARVFARLVELAIDRLNQAPHKNFLAFLDLLGLELRPPQPARVPLTFWLAAGSPSDALVPAHTQVAALPVEGETEPVIFETERELVVTRSKLVAAYIREPRRDHFDIRTAEVLTGTDHPFPVFEGHRPIEHRLYLGSKELFGKRPVDSITLSFDEPAGMPSSASWLADVTWSYVDATPTTLVPVAAEEPQSGTGKSTVKLNKLPVIPPATLNGTASAWLCGRYQEPLPPGAEVPRSGKIAASFEVKESGLLPDVAFANQLPVDPTKDFYPFGEKPKFNDTLYLAWDAALTLAGARIIIRVSLTNPSDENGTPKPANLDGKPTLSWEFWNAVEGRWALLGQSGPGATEASQYQFTDETEAFTKNDGSVSFDCPAGLGSTLVNAQVGRWIRVRIVKGDYGREAEYRLIDSKQPEQGYALYPATFRPPSIRTISLAYDYSSPPGQPDYLLTENDFVFKAYSQSDAGSFSFAPFTPPRDSDPTFYLGFQRPGDEIGFAANRMTALYFSVPEIPYDGGGGGQGPALKPARVVWEYWNGASWTPLGARDETLAFTRRGLLTFVGPFDFRSSTEFGQAAFWLRARWESGAYASPPQLQRVLTDTTWAAHTVTIQNEPLGSSNAELNQVFRTAKAPVLAGQRVEVREAELPSAADRKAIEADEGTDAVTTVLDASGKPVEIWVRWHQVPDFYESTPRSRHYVLDRLAGEVRFGDAQRGLIPPRGRSNVRAAWYQSGGGPQGNRAERSITQLQKAVPYVGGVTNWEPAAGGAAQETLSALEERGPRTLRHRDRVVAAADCEDLALMVSTDVARVKCIPARDSTDAGRVGLILVPRSDDPQPIPNLELVGRVKDYLQQRTATTADLWVAGPDWLKVAVDAEIVPVAPETATDVQTAVLARLRSFLHPLSGGVNGQGWDFGRRPYRSDLYAVIEGTPGVDHIRHLAVTAVADDQARPDRFLVYSGAHRITMAGAEMEG